MQNTPQNFSEYKLRIQTSSDSSEDNFETSVFRSAIDRRIKSVLCAAAEYGYSVKMTLTYNDTVQVYQFDTFLK